MIRKLLPLLLILGFLLTAFSSVLAGDETVNRHVFTGKEHDLNTGLIYFGARYYDPDTGRFITQDNYLGDPGTPPSLNRYLYAYSNPTAYFDLFGYESVSTMVDNAAEGCSGAGCYGWAFLKTAYSASTLGFAPVHDPQRDAYDAGKIGGAEYAAKGIGGGSALVAANVMTGRVAGTAMVGKSLLTQTAIGASTGAGLGALIDTASQVSNIDAGAQQNYNYKQTAVSTVVGGGLGAAVPAAGVAAETLSESILQSRITARATAGNTSGITMEDPSGRGAFLVAENRVEVASVKMPFTTENIAIAGKEVATLAEIEMVKPSELRFTQRTAGGRGRADALRQSMAAQGYKGEPIDVVRTADGLVTIDNTRPAVALEQGIENIPVRIHAPTDSLPSGMASRFGNAKTWGEAMSFRTANQHPALPPTGTTRPPRLPQPVNSP